MKTLHHFCFILVLLLLLSPTAAAAQADTSGLEQKIIDSCTYGNKVDISEYQLTEQELETLFFSLQNSGQLPWYTDRTYAYYYAEDTGLMLEFEPELLDGTVYDRTLYEQKLAQVLDSCVMEGMSQLQIALSLHDYLVLNTTYDDTETRNTGYDLIVNGTTMCAGYASAYQDLLIRAGVPCIYVTSEEMEHAWNLVCIDGQWYHVDVTWDDPTPDHYGLVSHEYFLLTDQEIAVMEKPHYGWETELTCTDTRYSNAFWRDLYSAVCYVDKDTCYLIRADEWINRIHTYSSATGKETTLFKEKETYVDIGYGDYTYLHHGLSYWCGRLYFSSLDQVFSISPDGTGLRSEYRYDAEDNDKYIYSCYINEDTAYLCLADHDGNTYSHTAELATVDRHIHSYTQTVQAPACTEPGYTLSVCGCGLSCKSNVTAATGHNYKATSGKPATFFSDGFSHEVCTVCAEETTQQLSRLDPATWAEENSIIVFTVGGAVFGGLYGLVLSKRKKAHRK